MSNNNDHADVAIRPPLLFLGALALGSLLSSALPLGTRLASPNGLALTVGLVFVTIGLLLAALAANRFRLAGTPVPVGSAGHGAGFGRAVSIHPQSDLYRPGARLFRACRSS